MDEAQHAIGLCTALAGAPVIDAEVDSWVSATQKKGRYSGALSRTFDEPEPMPIWTAASVESCMVPSVSAARDQAVDPVNNGADRDGQDTPPAGTTHDGYMIIPAGMAKNREDFSPALIMDDFRSGRSS